MNSLHNERVTSKSREYDQLLKQENPTKEQLLEIVEECRYAAQSLYLYGRRASELLLGQALNRDEAFIVLRWAEIVYSICSTFPEGLWAVEEKVLRQLLQLNIGNEDLVYVMKLATSRKLGHIAVSEEAARLLLGSRPTNAQLCTVMQRVPECKKEAVKVLWSQSVTNEDFLVVFNNIGEEEPRNQIAQILVDRYPGPDELHSIAEWCSGDLRERAKHMLAVRAGR